MWIKRILKRPRYFFIIGAARGGTSLLTAMLNYNPHLKVGFERFATDYLWAEKLKKQKQSSIDERINAFNKACVKESFVSGKYWGNKLVEVQVRALINAPGAEGADHVFKKFAQSVIGKKKLIFLFRDGRYCVRSKMNRENKDYKAALETWKFSVVLFNALKGLGVDMYSLRYEDLVSDPEKELKAVCEFLKVPYHTDMLKGPSYPKMPKVYRSTEIKEVPDLSEEQLSWTKDMEVELRQLGYLDENNS